MPFLYSKLYCPTNNIIPYRNKNLLALISVQSARGKSVQFYSLKSCNVLCCYVLQSFVVIILFVAILDCGCYEVFIIYKKIVLEVLLLLSS